MASLTLPRSEPASLSPLRSYSTEEWEAKRCVITQLYRDESKKLYNIRVILASEHGFRPTEAMLKKRIKKWSLDRKHKEPEMLAASRLVLEREALGKETVFIIRERVVTSEEVKRYFRRKGIKDLRSLAIDAEVRTSAAVVECHTPEPVTAHHDMTALDAHAWRASQRQFWVDHSTLYDSQNETSLTSPKNLLQVPPLMHSTQPLRQLEQLLYLGRTFYDGTFENPAWRTAGNAFDLSRLEKFYHAMLEGQRLLQSEPDHAKAFRQFGRAFDLISPLLRGQVLLFLPYLYHMIFQFRETLGQEVLGQLLRFISQMTETLHPQLTTVRRSLELLQRMSRDERVQFSRNVLESMLDRLRIEFLADRPDEAELQLDVCSLARLPGANSTPEGLFNQFKLTAIAVWKLIYETEHFWPRTEPEAWQPRQPRVTIFDSQYDLTPFHAVPEPQYPPLFFHEVAHSPSHQELAEESLLYFSTQALRLSAPEDAEGCGLGWPTQEIASTFNIPADRSSAHCHGF